MRWFNSTAACAARFGTNRRTVSAHRVGPKRRRAEPGYKVGTNLGRLSLAGKSRRLVSIRRSRFRALPASVGRALPGWYGEFTFGPSHWRPLDRLYARSDQPSAERKRHELYHPRRSPKRRDMELRPGSGRGDLGCDQRRVGAAGR
jgi:hypothetical protein